MRNYLLGNDMIVDIRIPEISENVESGKVVSVLVTVGDSVEVDDVLIELETEKAVVEIPSTVAGTVAELLAEEGEEKNVGDVIARIDTAAEISRDDAPADIHRAETARTPQPSPERAREAAPDTPEPEQPPETGPPVRREAQPVAPEEKPSPPESTPVVPASPSIRRLARELAVDLTVVSGSGPKGRITEADVKAHVRLAAGGRGSRAATLAGEPPLPDFSRWGNIETVELPTVRRVVAESVTTSWHTIPHVTQFDRADITSLQNFFEKNAKKAASKGVKLTVTAVLVRVCAEALKQFPQFNASIDVTNRQIVYKNYRHIGIAVDTENGLLVPVLRNADEKGILDIAGEIADMAERARSRKVKPDELEGGTFTLSNQGGIGGTNFTPVVLWLQVAILGVSRSSIEPVMINGNFEPRTILPLSLSYDHRMIDGADAARFMRWICDSLEQPFTMML